MPVTRKESFYFGLIMCTGMVSVMTIYNLILHDLIGDLTVGSFIIQFLSGFIVALVIDLFLVGPTVKKFVSTLPIAPTNIVLKVITMSFCMVTGMVIFMSLFGLFNMIMFSSVQIDSLLGSYVHIAFMNFIVAIPLQLIVMGPLVRFIFIKFVKKETAVA